MDVNQRARLGWIKIYEAHQDAGFVCRQCGISRPTLRKWLKRYEASLGLVGLKDQSKRPHRSPNAKVTPAIEELILSIRSKRKLGVKRLSNELLRIHGVSLSPPTIQKVLNRNGQGNLTLPPRWRKQPKRYNRALPGDRVQMDVCKIADATSALSIIALIIE